MRKMFFYVFPLMSLFVFCGCVEKRLEAEELMQALISAGYRVEKEARIHHSLEGAQNAMWLKIDGTRVAAYQFSTVARAKLRARTFQGGIYAGYWAFEFADARTAEKIKSALE